VLLSTQQQLGVRLESDAKTPHDPAKQSVIFSFFSARRFEHRQDNSMAFMNTFKQTCHFVANRCADCVLMGSDDSQRSSVGQTARPERLHGYIEKEYHHEHETNHHHLHRPVSLADG